MPSPAVPGWASWIVWGAFTGVFILIAITLADDVITRIGKRLRPRNTPGNAGQDTSP